MINLSKIKYFNIVQKLSKFILLIVFFNLTQSESMQAQAYKNRIVSWKDSQYASGYQVQIKNLSEKVVIDQKTEKNFLSVDSLKEGKYKVRTAALSPFGKPVVWSNWKELKVEISLPPKVKTADSGVQEAKKTISPDPEQIVEIEGENFNDATEATLESKESKTKIKVVDKKIDSKNKLSLKLDASNAKPGTYDLGLENPFHPKTTIKDFLEIKTKNQPVSSATKQENLKKSIYELKASDLDLMVSNSSNCYSSSLPSILVRKCEKDFLTLNHSEKEKKDIYNYLLLKEQNIDARKQAYDYFQSNCYPKFNAVLERLENESSKQAKPKEFEERKAIESTISKIKTCPRLEAK
ncbi:hypothetical protein [Leptospira sp. GIMC2001]|uniref:hypothetical protein n=1 Tax=Leptospira sp. GIMC2001 TaxID=1513297 RepID=UPI00234AA4D6|nr:hypothetical protein [Leptospira sp. GIMC2001]WCL50041.1 hypothetical protein O4O04_04260 [Leptospira sp. GIMC2001]